MIPKTILLVEDNPDDAELTIRAFRKNNIQNEIHIARDGVEAISWLARSDPQTSPLPAVVLLDLKLPKIDGLGVLRAIRAETRTRYLPVVILTSSTEDRDLINGYRLGANSYIRKPVDFGDFLKVALNLGLYWLELNEVPPKAAVPQT
jgi:two-component system response regulator